MVSKLFVCALFRVATVYLYLLFLVTAPVMFLVALFLRLLTVPLDPCLKLLHLWSCFWASLYTWLSPLWTVSISGRKNMDPDKAYVMICNHQSMLDILVIYRLFRHFKWVSKEELFHVPLVGWNMSLNRYIRIKRSSLQSQRNMLDACVQNLKAGSSVMIFPEGTRSSTSQMRPFKEGAFHVAREAGADILPMVLEGSARAVPDKGRWFRRTASIRLKILPPIPFSSVAHLSHKEMAAYFQDLIARSADASDPELHKLPSC